MMEYAAKPRTKEQQELVFGRWSKGQPIPFEEWIEYVPERRAANPDLVIPRNAGKRRTESKKALLKAIEEVGAKW